MAGSLRLLAIGLVAGAAIAAADRPAAAAMPAEAQYAPYAFLIGEWGVAAKSGGPSIGVQTFRWGPNQSYIWYAQSLTAGGKQEPHFEGLLMWNGVHRNLDMLLAVDLRKGLAEELGTLNVKPDGTVVREITAYFSEGVQPLGEAKVGPKGKAVHFRQTFIRTGPDKMTTSLMHETSSGWIPTFPGSDHLIMTRLDHE